MHGWDDTIVALATAPGIGALAIVRLSGKDAVAIVNTLFPSKDLEAQPTHTIHVGFLQANDQVIDEVVISLFKAPRSYTGENVVEISCHGSPFIQQQIIEACAHAGARLARPGEFTLRAFLNGRLDLAQAEAVADLIASSTQASRDTALHAMRGGFSQVLSQLREQMIKFSALIELELDFSQEDVEFADRTEFYKLLKAALEITQRLIESFRYGNVIRNGVRVAIVGKPNAGKSTLLNNLLNDNRAIVSDIAGTTRDTIEELLNIDGILFRLIDTAGIREHTSDVIEKAGMEKTYEKIREADIVMYVFDVNEMSAEELGLVVDGYASFREKLVLVGNKSDVHSMEYARNKFGGFAVDPAFTAAGGRRTDVPDSHDRYGIGSSAGDADSRDRYSISSSAGENTSSSNPQEPINASGVSNIVFISAKSDQHLDALKNRMTSMVFRGAVSPDETIVTNARHYESLRHVYTSLQDILKGLDSKLPGDLLALDIRRCLHYLGEITGEITTDDQLDYIFSKFCIGK